MKKVIDVIDEKRVLKEIGFSLEMLKHDVKLGLKMIADDINRLQEEEEMNHEIALCIIKNPGISGKALALECGCHESTIYEIKRKLNIPPRERPVDCVG